MISSLSHMITSFQFEYFASTSITYSSSYQREKERKRERVKTDVIEIYNNIFTSKVVADKIFKFSGGCHKFITTNV